MKKGKLLITVLLAMFYVSACNQGAKQHDGEMSHDEMHEEGIDHDDHHEHDHDEAEEETAELTVPEGAKVFFANIEDGQTVSSPLKVEFGVEGMEVEPAGELHQGMGHHHIIINGTALDRGVVVPTDSVNIHFGKGQTETELMLDPGEYTLTMQFADGYHQSYGEQMSATVNITVE